MTTMSGSNICGIDARAIVQRVMAERTKYGECISCADQYIQTTNVLYKESSKLVLAWWYCLSFQVLEEIFVSKPENAMPVCGDSEEHQCELPTHAVHLLLPSM
jgi:hypothetical protein